MTFWCLGRGKDAISLRISHVQIFQAYHLELQQIASLVPRVWGTRGGVCPWHPSGHLRGIRRGIPPDFEHSPTLQQIRGCGSFLLGFFAWEFGERIASVAALPRGALRCRFRLSGSKQSFSQVVRLFKLAKHHGGPKLSTLHTPSTILETS